MRMYDGWVFLLVYYSALGVVANRSTYKELRHCGIKRRRACHGRGVPSQDETLEIQIPDRKSVV